MDKEEHRELICFHWGNRLFSPGQRNPRCRLLFSFLLCPTVPTAPSEANDEWCPSTGKSSVKCDVQVGSKSNLRFMSNTNTQATPAMIGKTKPSWHSKSNGTEVPATQSKQYFLTWLYAFYIAFYTFLYHLYHNKFIKAPFKGWKIAMARHEADV